jgi:hypothetical protein
MATYTDKQHKSGNVLVVEPRRPMSSTYLAVVGDHDVEAAKEMLDMTFESRDVAHDSVDLVIEVDKVDVDRVTLALHGTEGGVCGLNQQLWFGRFQIAKIAQGNDQIRLEFDIDQVRKSMTAQGQVFSSDGCATTQADG